MTRGIYFGAEAMTSQMLKQDVLTNNLANVDSIGFKADRVSFAKFLADFAPAAPLRNPRPGVLIGHTLVDSGIDLSPGLIRHTGNPLDIALSEDVFLSVMTPAGVRYTRQGNLRLSRDGTLETVQGAKVLGERGPIRIQGNKVQITDAGEVVVDTNLVDRLALVRFSDASLLSKEGALLFAGRQATAAKDALVRPGYLEFSNVNPVRTMVEMMTTLRAYEAAQRTIQLQDEALARVMEVVRV